MTQITEKSAKTRWFPADINPVHKGVYRVVKSYGQAWAYWDGEHWSHGALRDTCPEPQYFHHDAHTFPIQRWRGVRRAVN